jgi:indole-3-acetate monooxygenase
VSAADGGVILEFPARKHLANIESRPNTAPCKITDLEGATMVGTTVEPEERELLLQVAREFVPEFSARASEGESLRTMPGDLVDRIKSAGLFRLALPRSLGGFELDPLTILEVVELLSEADGSAGWTVLIGNSTAFFAWLEPSVAAVMIGDETNFCSTSMFGPLGHATPVGNDAVTISGRWPFNSGCCHSEWLQVGVLVMEGTAPRMRDDTNPDWRFAFVRQDAAHIEDSWDALGLRGTGSHHLKLQDVRIPVEHMAAPIYEPARHDGPLWRLGLFDLAGILMSGFPLGVARRAIDEFTTIGRTKFRGNPANTVAGNDHAQMLLAQAESRLRAARLYVYEVVAGVWDSCCAGDRPAPTQRAELALAGCHAMRTALEAVDSLYRLAGAEAVFAGHPLERCFRDLHTGSQHIIFSTFREQELSRILLGIDSAAD